MRGGSRMLAGKYCVAADCGTSERVIVSSNCSVSTAGRVLSSCFRTASQWSKACNAAARSPAR